VLLNICVETLIFFFRARKERSLLNGCVCSIAVIYSDVRIVPWYYCLQLLHHGTTAVLYCKASVKIF